MGLVYSITLKPKLVCEESRLINISGHMFDHKTSVFSFDLRAIVFCLFIYLFLNECKPNGSKGKRVINLQRKSVSL